MIRSSFTGAPFTSENLSYTNMELIKEFNDLCNYWIVKCPKGHKITTWKEGDDILAYGSFSIAYCPKDADLEVFHCVTEEEDAKYLALQTEAIAKEIEKEEKLRAERA